jgi:hypothetical protein
VAQALEDRAERVAQRRVCAGSGPCAGAGGSSEVRVRSVRSASAGMLASGTVFIAALMMFTTNAVLAQTTVPLVIGMASAAAQPEVTSESARVNASGTAVFVSPNGTDSPGCGSANQPCATLFHAVNDVANMAQPIDSVVTVVVAPGRYNSSFCGARARRPLAVIGSGSGSCFIDCQHASQLLTTNNSISLSSITVVGGWVNVSDVNEALPAASMSTTSSIAASLGGGGAVNILWPTFANDMFAFIRDVVFVNNSVHSFIDGGGTQLYYVGGGALFVGGGGNRTTVVVSECTFAENSVSVEVPQAGTSTAIASGGGVSIVLGVDRMGEAAASLGQQVTLTSVSAGGNTMTCVSCYVRGK